jgi:hypothetical protein
VSVYQLWTPFAESPPTSPIVAADEHCDGDEAPATAEPAMWCPPKGWPPTPITLRLEPPVVVTDGQIADNVLIDVTAAARGWAIPASFAQVALAPGTALTQAGDRWLSPDGSPVGEPVPIGTINGCVLRDDGAAWVVTDPCPFQAPGPLTISLYPTGSGALLTIRGDLVEPLAPIVAAEPPQRGLVMLAAIGAIALFPVGLLVGMQLRRPVPVPQPMQQPPPARAATPLPAEVPPPNPFSRLLALQAEPAVRTLVDALLTDGVIADHAARIDALLVASRKLRSKIASTADWEGLERDAFAVADDLKTLAYTLPIGRADPDGLITAPPAVLDVWKRRLPDTEVRVTDGGAALAAAMRADWARTVLVPYVALAQHVHEVVPREARLPARPGDAFDHAAALAARLGYRYEHVPVYGRTDADFLLDRDVTLSGVGRGELPSIPADVPTGTVVRVRVPILRANSPDSRPLRAHLLVLREA